MERTIHTDIFIAGAGAAGIAAAIGAAGLGLRVCLAEKNSYPGGRATASAVGTICGLYLRSGKEPVFAMNGFPRQFAERLMKLNKSEPVKYSEGLWFLPFHPEHFKTTADSFLAGKNIRPLYDTGIDGVESTAGHVTAVFCTSRKEKLKIIPHCVIDCSGEGIVCKSLNHEIISDIEYQAAAIVFSLKNISASDEFQLNFSLLKKITERIERGEVPDYFSLLSVIPHSLSGDKVLLKMGLPWKVDPENYFKYERQARELVGELISFVRSSVSGFESSALDWVADEIGIRTGKRARGKSTLSDADVLSCRKQDDGICNGAWPVEYWRTGNKRVELTCFAEGDYYSIPAGCLESGEVENLFFAGKMISADEKAIASARVIGTCFGTGYSSGILAGYKSKGKSPQEAVGYIKEQMLDIR